MEPAAAVEFEALVTVLILGPLTLVDGDPVLLPPALIFPAFTTETAARLMFPVTRMPASPASMIPVGAIKSTSPAATPATVARTPIPPPVAKPARSVSTEAL